jgi:type III secretion protein U
MSEEKTKPPTPKKLAKAQEEGESVHSEVATSAGVLMGVGLMLWLGAGLWGAHARRLFDMVWIYLPQRDVPLWEPIYAMLAELAWLCVPLALAACLGGVLALMLQGAVTLSIDPVLFKFDKVDPVQGFKRFFALRAITDAGLMLVMMLLISAVMWWGVQGLLPLLVSLTARAPENLADLLWIALMQVLALGVVCFVVFGGMDFGLQHFLFVRDHRMDEEEIKRENKENFGDPEIKTKRRELAQELLQSDGQQAVAGASLVVANPTHFAVALFYQRGDVPRVVAKGMDDSALAIRRYAETTGVPVVVNPPLARTLYRVPVGAGIPRECFQLVGVLLHAVDQLRAQTPSSTPISTGGTP